MSSENQRLHYFDMLKGIAIFLVVMGHVLTMCIREIDRAVLFKLIGQLHMPLFFFISGYFTYRKSETGCVTAPALFPRFRRLVIPGIIMGLVWMVYFPHSGLQSPLDMSWSGMWCSQYKNGYWFTITLFEIIAVYAAWSFVLRKINTERVAVVATVLLWAALIVVGEILNDTKLYGLLSMELVIAFFPAFMTGVFARLSSGRFVDACSKSSFYTVALLTCGVLVYLLSYPWEFPGVHKLVFTIAAPALHVAIAVVGIALVKPWSEKSFSEHETTLSFRFASIWRYLGKRSLSIYLLHYFFLFPLPVLQQPLREMGLDLVPTLAVSVLVAACVVGVTLVVDLIICKSRILAGYIVGDAVKN